MLKCKLSNFQKKVIKNKPENVKHYFKSLVKIIVHNTGVRVLTLSYWLTVKLLYIYWQYFLVPPGGHGTDREVFLDLKHGVEAKSYEDVSTSTGSSQY